MLAQKSNDSCCYCWLSRRWQTTSFFTSLYGNKQRMRDIWNAGFARPANWNEGRCYYDFNSFDAFKKQKDITKKKTVIEKDFMFYLFARYDKQPTLEGGLFRCAYLSVRRDSRGVRQWQWRKMQSMLISRWSAQRRLSALARHKESNYARPNWFADRFINNNRLLYT